MNPITLGFLASLAVGLVTAVGAYPSHSAGRCRSASMTYCSDSQPE